MVAPGITQPKNALKIIRGTSKTYELRVQTELGYPVNLTGSRVIFSVKECPCDEHCLIQKDSARGATQVAIISPKGGIAQIYLDPVDTQTMSVGEYVFDAWVVLATGKRYAVIPPTTLEIEAGVTHIAI